MRAPAFAGDWLMGALSPAHAAIGKLEPAEYEAAWFGLLRTLVTRQLMLGQDAVVDDLLSESQTAVWHETAALPHVLGWSGFAHVAGVSCCACRGPGCA